MLELRRESFSANATAGRLFLDGRFLCFTLEDNVISAVQLANKTANSGGEVDGVALPNGTYYVINEHSPKFGRPMPTVYGDKRFRNVRFHGGNTVADTLGCILVAERRLGTFTVQGSYERKLYEIVEARGRIDLSITGGAAT